MIFVKKIDRKFTCFFINSKRIMYRSMKTIHEELRNLTIEEITKLEADTIGLSFFSKESELDVPFRKDESITRYQNLLSGNDRTVNREVFVHFERRQRDILEYIVKKIIPSGQSLFMAKQIDKGIKEFFDKNDGRNFQIVSYGSNKQYIPDSKAQSTDWINYFSQVDYAELPESLCEDTFIKSVYQIFSYQILPLRLQYHKENEGSEELLKIVKEVQCSIRYRLIDFSYPSQINELIDHPSDLKLLKKDFKHDIFTSFDDFCMVINYLFDFYSHLCDRIGEYEKTRAEKSREEKWYSVFRECAYIERPTYNDYDYGERKNESFWNSLEVLRLSDSFEIFKKEFGNTKEDEFFKGFVQGGARGLIQTPHSSKTSDFNSFIVLFINSIIEIVNSFSGSAHKLERISNIDDIDSVLKAITPNQDEFFHIGEMSESEKSTYQAICSITSELLKESKKYSEKLNTKQWFAFMRSLIDDKAFCMKEEQKSKNFVCFQNEVLRKSYSSSAFNDFVAQLTGVFEYQGFLTSIDMCLENLERLKISDKDSEENWNGFEYSYYKTSFDFIENALKKIREKAKTFKKDEKEKDMSPSWKHRRWCELLGSLIDKAFNLEGLPNQIDDWYFDSESKESKLKYDGKTSFKPLNIQDFKTILQKCVYNVPDTIATIIFDIFGLNDDYSFRNSNAILDKYKYSGLMEQNPFAHSTVSIFYKFLYDFFMYLRSNISDFLPRGLSQKKILEYSLMNYIAKFIINTKEFDYLNGKNEKDKDEEKRNFTLAKLFVKRYFEKKGGIYRPSMKCANIALKNKVKEAGLSIGVALSELAKRIDTKRKSEDLKNMPSSSTYVFNQIISDDSLFPKEIPSRVVKKYRMDYFNYYLLCNFIKTVEPYLDEHIDEDRTGKIFSEIIEGILNYTFYKPEEYKRKPIKSGFDYLLRQNLKNCNSYHVPFFEEYFWYSEQKDDRLLKKLRGVNYAIVQDCYFRMRNFSFDYYTSNKDRKFVDIELELKYAEYIRDQLGERIGDFYYNYYLAKLEYYKFMHDQKNNSLNTVVEYYEKAFKFIYSAGDFADEFVSDVVKLYSPIRESLRIFNRRKEDRKRNEEWLNYSEPRAKEYYENQKIQIEQEYEQSLERAKKIFHFDISSSSIREISIITFKRIWQWSEAAGVVGRSYEQLNCNNRLVGRIWNSYYYPDNSVSVRENFEKLIEELEKGDDLFSVYN